MLVVDNPKFEPEPPDSPKLLGKSNEQLRDIYSYLDEVERCSEAAIDTAKANLESVKAVTKTNILSLTSVPRLEELLAKNTVELAHEVLSLRLQVEDQSSGIKLLQQTVSEMKEAARAVNAAHEEAICKANVDAEAAVQRHQKFIKQVFYCLITETKKKYNGESILNSWLFCNSVAQRKESTKRKSVLIGGRHKVWRRQIPQKPESRRRTTLHRAAKSQRDTGRCREAETGQMDRYEDAED